ncbi:MAG: DUF885 domain-containing protein [Kangiellaceae bacterium]|jgi:uncharacterized protein (DUF885 family)|nr:DUF885 domain-containing protein [Kangiellaceae bacterium]
MTKRLSFVLVILSLTIGINAMAQPLSKSVATSATKQNPDLHQIFKDFDSYQDSMSPRYDHDDPKMRKGRMRDVSPEYMQSRMAKAKEFIKRVNKIDDAQLSQDDRISKELFIFNLKTIITGVEYQSYLFPMLGDTGFYFGLLRMGTITRLDKPEKAQFYLEQLASVPTWLKQWQSNLEYAIANNRVMPAVVLIDFEKPLKDLVATAVTENPLYQPFVNSSNKLSADDKGKFASSGREVLAESVYPAVKKFVEFVESKYLPKARKTIGISEIENGAAYYQSQIEQYTTLNMSADDIHEVGLAEVKRIKQEMMAVIKASGFKGSFAKFVEFLRNDSQFYAKTPDELLKEAAYYSKKMDGALPRFFKHLPRQPYGVEPVPAAIAPRYTTGRYSGAPIDSHRAGEYWVNTYALEKRPLYVLEALTLHEAVPGHHLQTALAQELEDLPKFRRQMYISAFGEGWALYCEKLGIEAGFYKTPYSQFGRLTYEMWRAIRLVVDTGMHMKGWSRERAIKFMEENTALSKHNVRTEIDRYISWPGQALSYKMGEIKIIELRKLAEEKLGHKFDIREFHYQVLKNGSVTLKILESQIRAWIDSELKQVNKS